MKKLADRQRIQFYLWLGLAYLLLWTLIDLANYPGQFLPRIINNIWRSFYIILVNFIFFEYIIDFVRRRKHLIVKILLGIFFFWLQLMLYTFGLYVWRAIGIVFHVYTSLRVFSSHKEGVSYGAAYGLMSLFFFGIARHVYNYVKLMQAAQQLRIEKQAAELSYLRSQTNPHFLFNTLNNIYALARDKSDLAPESILRLSQILRFMLYETGGSYIAIEQELKIINDYLALEKLRYDHTLSLNFNYVIEDMKQSLPPLLLIPLVENAFKHGVSETRQQPFVDIHLSVKDRQLNFIVKNSTGGSAVQQPVKENIGLSNLRRQLELLYKDYQITVQQEQYIFTAILKINLGSHVQD